MFRVFFLSLPCVCLFPKLFFFSGDTSQQAESHEGKSMKYATGGQAFSRPSPF